VFEDLIIGKYVKKHSHVLFAMRISLFSHTAVKLRLTLLNLPTQPKKLGPTTDQIDQRG